MARLQVPVPVFDRMLEPAVPLSLAAPHATEALRVPSEAGRLHTDWVASGRDLRTARGTSTRRLRNSPRSPCCLQSVHLNLHWSALPLHRRSWQVRRGNACDATLRMPTCARENSDAVFDCDVSAALQSQCEHCSLRWTHRSCGHWQYGAAHTSPPGWV